MGFQFQTHFITQQNNQSQILIILDGSRPPPPNLFVICPKSRLGDLNVQINNRPPNFKSQIEISDTRINTLDQMYVCKATESPFEQQFERHFQQQFSRNRRRLTEQAFRLKTTRAASPPSRYKSQPCNFGHF